MKQLEEYLQDHSIRPLTDHVVVKNRKQSITILSLPITFQMTTEAQKRRSKGGGSGKRFIYILAEKVGRDVTPARLVYEVMQAGAQSVDITSPAYTKS